MAASLKAAVSTECRRRRVRVRGVGRVGFSIGGDFSGSWKRYRLELRVGAAIMIGMKRVIGVQGMSWEGFSFFFLPFLFFHLHSLLGKKKLGFEAF